jgi:signal transduction histidine kinase
MKSQFLSIASHDLRAPLTVIRNFMSLLLENTYGPIPRAAQDGMQQVFDRATDMAKSVETYLNVSRIEQGRMKYDFIDVEAGPLIRNAVRAFGTNAEKKGLAFSFTEAPDLQGKKARLDVAKINEVLNNLLDNSIKYTPSGSITVALERRDDMARVTVRDTGVGMSKETLGRLFQLFSTAPDSQKINISSTGVGLYIAKAHAEAHGGRLWAESEGEGKGSTFILEIPLLK